MGSEMCIRDRLSHLGCGVVAPPPRRELERGAVRLDRHAKYFLMDASYERAATVGFRCAYDAAEAAVQRDGVAGAQGGIARSVAPWLALALLLAVGGARWWRGRKTLCATIRVKFREAKIGALRASGVASDVGDARYE